MTKTDAERRESLAALGLPAEGPALTPVAVLPIPDAPATPVVSTPVGISPALPSDTELLVPGAFDRFKLSARDHGRNVSSTFNKALHARICMLAARAKRDQPEPTGYVRERVRTNVTETATAAAVDAVVALLAQHGLTLDDLPRLTQEANS